MMKLLFKQRLFSWFDSYDVFDENGNTVFIVKGELAWGHCLQIYDAKEQHVGTVKEEVMTLLPKFRMYQGEKYIGDIRKELSFFVPKFSLDCNGWKVEGNFLEWDYVVKDKNEQTIMKANKQLLNLTDTYSIEVYRQEDALYSLMIVLAIDAAKASSK